MPHIHLLKKDLFERLELPQDYPEEKFRDLCFEFGVEVEEIVLLDKAKGADPNGPKEIDIEIPANRYDLLCMEGFARAFRFFMGLQTVCYPYQLVQPANPITMIAKKSVMPVRHVVVCAVLRNITFTETSFQSFIDYQEKLHQNICRKRSLASIGTHDLDNIISPFTYEGVEPTGFKFVTLRGTTEVDGLGMMAELSKDENIKEYLPLIRDKSHYPVIFDAKRRVLSVPPIINGSHSKISVKTKNIFIEVTALDLTKANVVLNMICLNFSEYCAPQFQVEQVKVHYEEGDRTVITPEWPIREVSVSLEYLTRTIGVPIEADKVVNYLLRLQVPSVLSADKQSVVSSVPPIRPDILHPCDIMEDVAIGFGFPQILNVAKPPPTLCHGKQLPINQFTDDLRVQCALAGWAEVLTFSLCSEADNFAKLNRKNDGSAVVIGNPQGADFQNVRVSLFPGLLNTIRYSKSLALPIKIFEISDICLIDPSTDVGASNKRALCAFYVNQSSAFENIHGFFDRIMQVIGVLPKEQFLEWQKETKPGRVYHRYYWIEHAEDPIYLSGTCGRVHILDTRAEKETVAGTLGILHPHVLKEFTIMFPISAVHLDVEVLMEGM